MKPIQKPAWLLFAAEVRAELDNLPIRKSNKPYERRVLDRYREARASKGYEGSLADWEYLLHRLGNDGRRALWTAVAERSADTAFPRR